MLLWMDAHTSADFWWLPRRFTQRFGLCDAVSERNLFFFWLDLHTLLFFSAEYATCTTSRTCVLVTLQGYHISSRMGFDLMGGSGGNSLHWARLPQYTRLCCISTVIYYLPRVADRLGLLQARIP